MSTIPVPSAAPAPTTSTLIAKRGAHPLDVDELRAHLAGLLRVEHVAAFLGSGASSALGGKTISEAWASFKATFPGSHAWLLAEKFIKDDTTPPNIEELIDAVEICRLERARSGHSEKSKAVDAEADLRRALVSAAALNATWWKVPPTSMDETSLKHHRLLLQKMCGARQPGQPAPWVFTLNYDLAIEWAAESLGLAAINGFSGLHGRRFSPHNFDLGFRNVLAKGEARFGTYNFYLAKLHGSLNWIDVGGDVVERSSTTSWEQIEGFLSGKLTEEFRRIVALPGAAKFVTTTGFVLGELIRRFTDLIARPQTTLVVNGYSGSDDHINRLLLTALQNPTLQLVICARSAKFKGREFIAPINRPWIRRIADLDLPQVTIVCGDDAEFPTFVGHLPEPALYDEQAAAIRRLLRETGAKG